MKVYKSKGMDSLIEILDNIYHHESVKAIKTKLRTLNDGEQISESDVDKIFMGPTGNWANLNPTTDDPHKVIKIVCANIKETMFK